MSKAKNLKHKYPTGADLELFRLKHAMTLDAVCNTFGVTRSKWDGYTRPENCREAIDDHSVAILYELYELYPQLIPTVKVDIQKIYQLLGGDTTGRRKFAFMLGRRPAAAYLWLDHNKDQSLVVKRLCQALEKLPQPQKTLLEIVESHSSQLGIKDFWKVGWTGRAQTKKADNDNSES